MSAFDIADSLFRLLNVPSVRALIDGSIWKFNRPINSSNVDVVISVPEYNAGSLNTGYVDVNVHAPNLNLVNPPDQTQPDLVKMKSVVDAILPLLTTAGNFDLSVRISGIPVREANGQWYANIRIGFVGVDDSLSEDVQLYELTRVSDGFGGYTSSSTLAWSGKGAQIEVRKGNQLSTSVDRYEFNLISDWIIPFEATKNMQLHSIDGVYTIKGIVKETKGIWRLNTVRIDG